MNILYTITAYPPSQGGAQIHLHEFVKRMARQHQVAVAYQWDEARTDWLRGTTVDAPPAYRPPPLDGIPVYRIAPMPDQRQQLRVWVQFYRLAQDAAVDRISNVLLANLRSAMYDLLGKAADIVHNSRIGREGLTVASLKLARALGVPFVLTPNHHHHWQGWLYRQYMQVYRAADAVIAQTNIERDMLIKLGVSPDRLHVLGVGATLAPTWDAARFRCARNIPLDAPLVLFVGQKFAYKRFGLVLKAAPIVWRRNPETRFVFIGPCTAYSRRLFVDVHDPRIVELDTVDLQTKTDAFAACDIFCMPSSKESFGGVYLEAGYFRKPVIGGSAPAVREVIRHGETGLLAEDNPHSVAESINTLLADPGLREAMGQQGQALAQRYDWDNLALRLQAIYEQVRSS